MEKSFPIIKTNQGNMLFSTNMITEDAIKEALRITNPLVSQKNLEK